MKVGWRLLYLPELTLRINRRFMPKPERTYLDNAATTWPKPESVYVAIEQAMRGNGAAVGRSVFGDSAHATKLVQQARRELAGFINADFESSVVFTNSGTDSLSTAILGLLKPNDRVVTTAAEHNSVLRPLHHLQKNIGVQLEIVPCDEAGLVLVDDVVSAIDQRTRLLVVNHVSNVTGTVQPVQEMIAAAKAKHPELIVLLDAAQSLGHLPIDVKQLACDMLAAPGHKGVYGPLGTGVLYLHPDVAGQVSPLRLGGTGVSSGDVFQPTTMPEKFEAGNLNAPAIAGLAAGLQFLKTKEAETTKANFQHCSELLLTGLRSIEGVSLHLPSKVDHQIGIFSVSIDGFDPHEAANMLDMVGQVQVRSGLHCAPLLHRRLGTFDRGGTIRFSVGRFTTPAQIDRAVEVLREVSQSTI